jgi:hypothetical protein
VVKDPQEGTGSGLETIVNARLERVAELALKLARISTLMALVKLVAVALFWVPSEVLNVTTVG